MNAKTNRRGMSWARGLGILAGVAFIAAPATQAAPPRGHDQGQRVEYWRGSQGRSGSTGRQIHNARPVRDKRSIRDQRSVRDRRPDRSHWGVNVSHRTGGFAAGRVSAPLYYLERPGRKPDVDIDRLKADTRWTWGGPTLSVAFEVETEDAAPGRFEMLITVTDSWGQPLRDRQGRSIRMLVPLNNPSEFDGDELEYTGRVSTEMWTGRSCGDSRMKVRAVVIDRRTGRVIETDSTTVKIRR